MSAGSVILAVVVASCAPAQADEKFQKDVAAAREKAVQYLKSKQTPQGHWEGQILNFVADMDGGTTALVTLSMLEAGVPPDDAAVKKALDYLAALPPKKTYVVSLQTQVLAKADAKKYADQIQKNADWLIDTAVGYKKNGKLEGWSYPISTITDNSNTHFAVFGLHAAAKAGAKVDEKVWPAIRDYYVRTQGNRGWTYHTGAAGDTQATYSMTAAAAVGLAVVDKHIKPADAGTAAFEKGMNAVVAGLPGTAKSAGYVFLVHAELGRAIGSPTFKSGDKERAWYREGAEKLVKQQNADGSWVLGQGIDAAEVLTTALGLYFLGPPEKK